ncbi:hypothetical protein CRYUN_Cryun27aG0029700 [Craigia yunnanensis]
MKTEKEKGKRKPNFLICSISLSLLQSRKAYAASSAAIVIIIVVSSSMKKWIGFYKNHDLYCCRSSHILLSNLISLTFTNTIEYKIITDIGSSSMQDVLHTYRDNTKAQYFVNRRGEERPKQT